MMLTENKKRPYTYPVVLPAGDSSRSLYVPKGYLFIAKEIRVIRANSTLPTSMQIKLNSTAKSIEFSPVFIPVMTLCTQKLSGQVTAVKHQRYIMADGDFMVLEVDNAAAGDKIAVVGELVRND